MKRQQQLEILWDIRTAAEAAIDAEFYRLAALEARRVDLHGLPLSVMEVVALEAGIAATKKAMARDKRDLAVITRRILALETEMQRGAA